MYVFDLSRPSTYKNISKDLEYLRNLVPGSIIKIVGNKLDLVSKDEIEKVKNTIALPWSILTCAKTGENVEMLFHDLGAELLEE